MVNEGDWHWCLRRLLLVMIRLSESSLHSIWWFYQLLGSHVASNAQPFLPTPCDRWSGHQLAGQLKAAAQRHVVPSLLIYLFKDLCMEGWQHKSWGKPLAESDSSCLCNLEALHDSKAKCHLVGNHCHHCLVATFLATVGTTFLILSTFRSEWFASCSLKALVHSLK